MGAIVFLAAAAALMGAVGLGAAAGWHRVQRARRRRALYRAGHCIACGCAPDGAVRCCPACGDDLYAQAMEYWRSQFPAEDPAPPTPAGH